MTLNKKSHGHALKKRHLVTYSNPDSIISDQFRTIRTNITFLTAENQNKVILVTSPGKREGKSTTTANLAVSMAGQKERVLLIDASIREPAIHRIFKVQNETGLTDVLTYKATLEEVICKPGIGKLDILPSGSTSSHNPAELLGSDTMENLLTEVTKEYDIVLIDSPTVLKSTETRVLANQCDGVVLVVSRGKTSIEKAVEARKILALSKSKLVGTIMNEK
ncbi:tyrosine protein kinase [Virgibacillus profundi]|uniref:non-specific protein-tyrosine kinase n=1 Tax=Virgibacillus profundi TaxID=2024555 RepID=A0A2A2IHT3_9BACI|nr:tyrosine protein kinase [Virgibacillus profundi]PXY55747.1 tyrosine protein kinase [Virgibacillus profundi]